LILQWIAIEFVVVYLMCPETMGTSLEDVALILEGSKATVSKIHPIAEALAEKSGNVGENIDHMEKTE
jgi:hypothetical protein